ncbi:MAG TPA: YdbL family protein [Steroidobacteraceae bacterium]|nr:YdbL family protein [Steroidobacteraceae bacterium]
MIRWITAGIATTCVALAACVTINVYFPAAAAEKAADRIIDDIWGPEQAAKPPGNEQSSIGHAAGGVLVAALDFVIPAAHAQADIDVSSPAIRALTSSMKSRAGQLDPFFDSGAIGLTADGLVEIRDANAVALADRNKLRKLVADDNADRNSLYREIASANGHPEWEADIRSTFAERWIAKAGAGWYHKSKSGDWKKK